MFETARVAQGSDQRDLHKWSHFYRMIYYTPPTTSIVPYLYDHSLNLGAIITPDSDRPNLYNVGRFRSWIGDNGCFSAGERFCETRFLHWLLGLRRYRETCAFVVAPDVVGDAKATWHRSVNWLGLIKALGFPSALVAQDGFSDVDVYWDLVDVLFVGGTDNFKMGPHGAGSVIEGLLRGKRVHVGRVNSKKRLNYFKEMGCSSADGTCAIYGPNVNIPKIISWIDQKTSRE